MLHGISIIYAAGVLQYCLCTEMNCLLIYKIDRV